MSAVVEPGSWAAWIAAFDRVYANLSGIAEETCPSCGAMDLRIAFTGDVDSRLGYASFWCNSCLNGIFTSRLHIPFGVDVVPFGLSVEEREKIIPNFRVIPPAPAEDDDSESAIF